MSACQQKQLNIVSELMSLDDKDTPPTGLDISHLTDDDLDHEGAELGMVHGRKAGQGLLQGKRNKLKMQMYEEKEVEENIKVRGKNLTIA